MGRQINFFQTDEDIRALWELFLREGLVVFDLYGGRIKRPEPCSVQHDRMLFIGTPDTALSPTLTDEDIRAASVEYLVPSLCKEPRLSTPPIGCRITREGNRIRYEPISEPVTKSPIPSGAIAIENGRFYLPNEAYGNQALEKLYSRLVTYIKKNYVYSKRLQFYYGPHFDRLYREKKVFATNGGRLQDLSVFAHEEEIQ